MEFADGRSEFQSGALFHGLLDSERVFCPHLQSGRTQRSCQEALLTHTVPFPFCATQCDKGALLGQHSYMGFWGVWCNPVGSQTRTCEAFIHRPSFLCRALQPSTWQPHQDTAPLKDLAAMQASFPRRVSSHCPF